MSKKKPQFEFIRSAFGVNRYHICDLIKPETVGHHTAGVIAILFHLYDQEPPIKVIQVALHHDVPEGATGDIPYTAKKSFPEINLAVEFAEEMISKDLGLSQPSDLLTSGLINLKYADMMDLCFKCVEEMSKGNQPMDQILARGMVVVERMLHNEPELQKNPRAHELFKMLLDNPYVNIEVIIHEVADKSSQH